LSNLECGHGGPRGPTRNGRLAPLADGSEELAMLSYDRLAQLVRLSPGHQHAGVRPQFAVIAQHGHLLANDQVIMDGRWVLWDMPIETI
jgi:hypothetical protein